MSDKREPPEALPPEFEPAGPTVEHDISRSISRYGKEAVLAAVKNLTKAKRGRKPEKDWPLLAQLLQQDVFDWLEGRDPIQLRSHYATAQAFAVEHPGHNQTATVTRVMKKLSSRRRSFFLTMAWEQSESTRPYTDYLRTLEALAGERAIYASLMNFAQNDVARYREMHGEPPSDMTMATMRRATENALVGFVRNSAPHGSLLGAAKDSSGNSSLGKTLGDLFKPPSR